MPCPPPGKPCPLAFDPEPLPSSKIQALDAHLAHRGPLAMCPPPAHVVRTALHRSMQDCRTNGFEEIHGEFARRFNGRVVVRVTPVWHDSNSEVLEPSGTDLLGVSYRRNPATTGRGGSNHVGPGEAFPGEACDPLGFAHTVQVSDGTGLDGTGRDGTKRALLARGLRYCPAS